MPASANPARSDAVARAATGPGIPLARYLTCDQMNDPDGPRGPSGSGNLVDAAAELDIPNRTIARRPGGELHEVSVAGWLVGRAQGIALSCRVECVG